MGSPMTDLCAHVPLPLGFAGIGFQEIMIVAVIFLVLFGGAKLPSLMRNMGRSINEFKAGMQDKPSGTNKDEEKIMRSKSHAIEEEDSIEEETASKN